MVLVKEKRSEFVFTARLWPSPDDGDFSADPGRISAMLCFPFVDPCP